MNDFEAHVVQELRDMNSFLSDIVRHINNNTEAIDELAEAVKTVAQGVS